MFSRTAITRVLSDEPYGQRLHFFRTIDSTNAEAMRLAAEGAPEGTLVVADEQTAGRGRAGRRWFTPPGSGLAVSLVLRPVLPANQIGHLGLLGGVATVQAIESLCNLRPKLKWPNDILVNEKKVAGILGESSHQASGPEWMVLGIGINVNTGPPSGTEARHKASFLTEQSGHPLNRVRLLLELVRALAEHYPQLGQTSLVTAWERRMIWRGKRVRVLNPGGTPIEGIALGLAPDGELRLQLHNGRIMSITAGDVSLTDT
jgi:BirA family biotin operon repressor/biotin-[acetyl-CoA-carboxylase] ligase